MDSLDELKGYLDDVDFGEQEQEKINSLLEQADEERNQLVSDLDATEAHAEGLEEEHEQVADKLTASEERLEQMQQRLEDALASKEEQLEAITSRLDEMEEEVKGFKPGAGLGESRFGDQEDGDERLLTEEEREDLNNGHKIGKVWRTVIDRFRETYGDFEPRFGEEGNYMPGHVDALQRTRTPAEIPHFERSTGTNVPAADWQ